MKAIVIVTLFVGILALDPPIFPDQYQIRFNETAKIGPLSG